MSKNNKCRYGLKNVYFAAINGIDLSKGNETAYSYGTPFPARGAQALSLTNQYASASIAADDDADYITMTQNNGYDGTLQIVAIPKEFAKEILLEENGVEDANVKPKDFAIICEFAGDLKKGRRCLWHCVLTKKPDIVHNTMDGNLKVDNDTLNIKIVKRKDNGKIKATAYEDWEVYDKMITEIPKPSEFIEPASISETNAATVSDESEDSKNAV